MYSHNQNEIIYICGDGSTYIAARCVNPKIASIAVDLLNRGIREQNKRHYKASARLHFQAEQLDGFLWKDIGDIKESE